MSSESTSSKTTKKAWGFSVFFGVLGANILFMFGLLWIAESHKPELVEEHYYTVGSIDSVKKQGIENQSSGWLPQVNYEQESSRLIVVIRDMQHRQIDGLKVIASMYRPSSDLMDRPAQTLVPLDSTKYYIAIQPRLQYGLWNLLLSVSSNDGKHYSGRFPIYVGK